MTALRDTESALATYSRALQRDEDLVVAQARAQEAESQARRLYATPFFACAPFVGNPDTSPPSLGRQRRNFWRAWNVRALTVPIGAPVISATSANEYPR